MWELVLVFYHSLPFKLVPEKFMQLKHPAWLNIARYGLGSFECKGCYPDCKLSECDETRIFSSDVVEVNFVRTDEQGDSVVNCHRRRLCNCYVNKCKALSKLMTISDVPCFFQTSAYKFFFFNAVGCIIHKELQNILVFCFLVWRALW